MHVGVYNGENYQRTETNNQKGFEFRGSLRPLAAGKPVLRGLRAHLVYYNDAYVSDGERQRVMGNVTYEHKFVNAGFDYLDADDQALPTTANIPANGYSIWATPRYPFENGSSWEALIRYDHWTPNTTDALAPASTAPVFGTTLLQRPAPEPNDLRRRLLVPASGERQRGDSPRLRRAELRQHHDTRNQGGVGSRAAQLLRGRFTMNCR